MVRAMPDETITLRSPDEVSQPALPSYEIRNKKKKPRLVMKSREN